MIDPPAEEPSMLSTPIATAGGSRFRFAVHGIPVQQGSKNCRCINNKPNMYDVDAHRLAAWRKTVATIARHQFAAAGHVVALDGPLQVTAEFRFAMPANRSAGAKSTGRIWKQTSPDLDKLMRSLGDSLTDAKVIRDDARIVRQVIAKTEVHLLWTGVDVTVEQLWNAP